MHEEVVTQMNQCIKKLRPQEDLISIRVGMDDSGEAICVEYEGTRNVWGVKAIASLARALSQPHPTTRNDGDHSTVKVVRQIRDAFAVESATSDTDGLERIKRV